MPSTSKKQASFMQAIAKNPRFAKKVGVSQKVGKEFNMADKKKGKYAEGGDTQADGSRYPVRVPLKRPGKPPMNSPSDRMRPSKPPFNSPSDRMKSPPASTRPDPYERMPKKSEGWNEGMLRPDTNINGKKKGGKVKKYAKGGSIDGVAKKGKTHTKMVKMKKGGKC